MRHCLLELMQFYVLCLQIMKGLSLCFLISLFSLVFSIKKTTRYVSLTSENEGSLCEKTRLKRERKWCSPKKKVGQEVPDLPETELGSNHASDLLVRRSVRRNQRRHVYRISNGLIIYFKDNLSLIF